MSIEKRGNALTRFIDFLHRNIISVIVVFVIATSLLSIVYILLDKGKEVADDDKAKFSPSDSIYFAIQEPENLNVITTGENDVYFMWQLLYSSLFKFDENLGLKKDLVAGFSTDAKLGTVEVTLRDNCKFSDGSDLTAADIRNTVDMIKSYGASSPFYDYASKISYVDVRDNYHLNITFQSPSDASLNNLVFPIVDRGNASNNNHNLLLGSGMYKPGEIEDGKSITLVGNPHYYGEKPENNIIFKFVTDKDNVAGMMTMGAITAGIDRRPNAKADAADKKLKHKFIKSSRFEFLGFNAQNPYLSNKIVRKAIVESINFEAITEDYFADSAKPNGSIYFPGYLGVDTKPNISYSSSKAVVAMEKLGYKLESGEQRLLDKEGNQVRVSLLVNSGNTTRVSVANELKKYLEKIGIDCTVVSVDEKEYLSRIEKGQFDIYIGGIEADPRYDLRKLFDKSYGIGYSNKDILHLLGQMEQAVNPERRKELFEKLQSELSEEAPYYCIGYLEYGFVSGGRFQNDVKPTFFDIYRGCSKWKWEKPDSL